MNAIFACKLYRASKHKDKIQAALSNPINTELVQQLSEYLSDATVDELDTSRSNSDVESKPSNNDVKSKPSDRQPISYRPSPATFHPTNIGGDDSDDSSVDSDVLDSDVIDSDTVESTDANDLNDGKQDNEPSAVNQSTQIHPTSVCAQTVLYNSSTISVQDIPDSIDMIKGTLNSRGDTSQVNRVLCKDSELWIYYNDSVNLNTVMGPVIELLNASGYTYLDFNRLARTDNAIVFQISLADTSNLITGVGDSDGK